MSCLNEFQKNIHSECEFIINISRQGLIVTDDALHGSFTVDHDRVFNAISRNNKYRSFVRSSIIDCMKTFDVADKAYVYGAVATLLLHDNEITSDTLNDLIVNVTCDNMLHYLFERFDDEISFAVYEAFIRAGLLGTISLCETSNSKTTVELSSGAIFLCKPLLCLDTSVIRDNAFSMIVDGAIERVSEINSILEHFSKTLQPLVIFARRFGEDVISTISSNFKMKKLDIFLVEVSEIETDVNSIIDIAMICESDIINSLKGQIVSAIDPASFKKIDSICLTQKKVIINNESAKQSVYTHIQNLIKSIDDNNRVSLSRTRDAIMLRVNSLMNRRALIHVRSCVRHESDVLFETFAKAITIFRSALARGILIKKDLMNDNHLSLLCNTMNGTFSLTTDVIIAIKIAKSLKTIFSNSNMMINAP